MSTRERPRRGVLPPAQENIEKIAKVVKDGNCYGAQQMYKSISARYISAERYSEALDILHSGSCIQLEHGQVTCGAELALLFVETLVKGKYPYDEDTLGQIQSCENVHHCCDHFCNIYSSFQYDKSTLLDRVRKIYKKFPRIPVPQHLDLGDDDDMQKLSEALGAAKVRVECCSSFLKAAIKWSAEVGAHRNGSPELHDMLAEYIYSESPEADMARVSYHFVRGKHPRKFASMLVNFMGKVRLLLILNAIYSGSYLPSFSAESNASRLQRDALPLFNMLRQTYKSSIDREPVFNELLDVIAEKFYEVPRRNPLMQGMFGDIFKVEIVFFSFIALGKMMGGDGYNPCKFGTRSHSQSANNILNSSAQFPVAQKRWASQSSAAEDNNKFGIAPHRGGEPKDDDKDTSGVVYYCPISNTLKHVKLLSLSTCCLSVSLGPVITFMTSTDTNVILKGAVASSVIFFSASTTAALHWFVSPYIHKLRWQPGSDSFEVEMMSWLATFVLKTIKFADIRMPETNRPYVTFKANGEFYYVDAEHCHNKALLARLTPQKATTESVFKNL
ncbi:hypothetical protein RHGRI_007620 [Rhododendron griersonianum]|uniref:Uncharacterized protein n=1 Tax=Rhododendron griersonianum TaxID=479676 RepID=A0AAV6KZ33_9ERIC|nr:hypothetical protein RHGRI_007620 [Rhododendron griersonianum]